MYVRAIRGAITVDKNDSEEIINASAELLEKIIDENKIDHEDIISVIFSVTKDLNAAFPAVGARRIGLTQVALFCTNEIDVPGSLEMCIRVMVHINTEKKNSELKHVYLKGASVLRPDLNL